MKNLHNETQTSQSADDLDLPTSSATAPLRDTLVGDTLETERPLDTQMNLLQKQLLIHQNAINRILQEQDILLTLQKHTFTSTFPKNQKVQNYLDWIQFLFANRISHENLSLKINCPEHATFQESPYYLESILINLIGKAFYRAIKNSTVTITVHYHAQRGVTLQVTDAGFALSPRAEAIVTENSPFFLQEDIFNKKCVSFGLSYKIERTAQGLNKSTISIPSSLSVE